MKNFLSKLSNFFKVRKAFIKGVFITWVTIVTIVLVMRFVVLPLFGLY